jgi:hypothetical protein
MITRLALAAFLVAHAAIHSGFVSPRPVAAGGPPWPFDLGRSWALAPLGVGPDITRLLGIALVAVTIGGFGLAAIGALGVAPTSLWAAGTVAGAVASIALLLLFFHPWLVLGIAVDLGLLWVVLMSDWAPDGIRA